MTNKTSETPLQATSPAITFALVVNISLVILTSIAVRMAIDVPTLWWVVAILILCIFTEIQYFKWMWIYVPINNAVILINERTGTQKVIGGPNQQGHRLKPSLFDHPESEKDYISLQRRWIKDREEKVTTKDKVRLTITYSGSYVPDINRLIAWRSIEAAGVDEEAEGAFSALIKSESGNLNLDQVQTADDLQNHVNMFEEMNEDVIPQPGSTALKSQFIERLRKRWPVAQVQLDIEQVETDADTRNAQEGLKQGEYVGEIATKVALPQLPKKDTVQYKHLLRIAKEEHAKLHPIDPETSASKPVELSADDEEAAVYAVLFSQVKGLSYKEAFDKAMILANQTQGQDINITGNAGGAGIIVPGGNLNQNKGRRKKPRN